MNYTIMFFDKNGDTHTGVVSASDEKDAREKFYKYTPEGFSIDRVKKGILNFDYEMIDPNYKGYWEYMENGGTSEAEDFVWAWAEEDYENGAVLDRDDYREFSRLCDESGIKPSKSLFDYYFECIDNFEDVGEIEDDDEDDDDEDLEEDIELDEADDFGLPTDSQIDRYRKHVHNAKVHLKANDGELPTNSQIDRYQRSIHNARHALKDEPSSILTQSEKDADLAVANDVESDSEENIDWKSKAKNEFQGDDVINMQTGEVYDAEEVLNLYKRYVGDRLIVNPDGEERGFILPDGVITTNKNNLAHYKEEQEFADWLAETQFIAAPGFYGNSGHPGENAMDKLGCIRINGYNEDYVCIPRIRPTTDQFDALVNWLDLFFKNSGTEILISTPTRIDVRYKYPEYSGYEICQKIKGYYINGRLFEQKMYNIDIDESKKKKKRRKRRRRKNPFALQFIRRPVFPWWPVPPAPPAPPTPPQPGPEPGPQPGPEPGPEPGPGPAPSGDCGGMAAGE